MLNKNFKWEIKAKEGEEGVFTGHASVFNNVDDGGDRILPGAFRKTIIENGPEGKNRVKVVALHDYSQLPIGIPRVLSEDENGLYFEAKISDTTLGEDVKKLLRDRVLTELSIGYAIPKGGAFYDKEGVRNITEINLYEFGPQLWGMNEMAKVTGYKNLGGEGGVDFQIGKKGFTLEEEMLMEQLGDLMWDARRAINNSLWSIIWDKEMSGTEKITMADQSLMQFRNLMLEVIGRFNTINDLSSKSLDLVDMVTKAVALCEDSELTEESKGLLAKNVEALKAIIAVEPETPEPDQKSYDDIMAQIGEIKSTISKGDN